MKRIICIVMLLTACLCTSALAREGGAVFVMSDFEDSDFSKATAGMSINKKSNSVSVTYDGEKGSNVLLIDKSTSDDSHLDIDVTAYIDYLAYEADIKLENAGALVYPLLLFNSGESSRIEDYPLIIDESGNVKMRNGSVIHNASDEKWFNIKFVYDFQNQCFDVYINGALKTKAVSFSNAALNEITDLRIWIYSPAKKSKLYIDNLKIYEGKTFKNALSESAKSIFYSEDDLAPYLEKLTLYNRYSGKVYNGSLIQSDSSESFTVSEDVIYKMFGKRTSAELESYAMALGKYTLDAGEGLFICSDYPIKLRSGIIRQLNSYMLFEHPDKEKIKADFEKNISPGEHPRLLANKADFEKIKRNISNSALPSQMNKTLISKADEYLSYPVVEYTITDRILLNVSRSVMTKMTYWGYAYMITGDKKYPQRAWKEFEAICAFPDWHHEHYIDAAEMMYGAAIGYDWMYGAFSEEQRKTIADAIIEKGVLISWQAYHGRLLSNGLMGAAAGFATDKNNFNIVSNASTIAAALAVCEENEDLCFDTLADAVKSLENGISLYYPSGSWEEGIGYWLYAANYLSFGLSAMDTCLKTHYGLSDYPGVKQTPYYAIGLDSFVSVNNFHDAWPGHLNASCYSYFAKLCGDNALFSRRRQMLANPIKDISPTIYDILWYGDESDEKVKLPLDIYSKGTEAFAMRGGWDKADSLFVSGHGGKTNAYHSHMDAGSFVFDIMGERWAHDLEPENYAAEYGYSIGRSFRRRAEAHNCVVINPKTCGQNDMNWNSSTYVKLTSGESASFAVQDLTEAYSDGLSSGITYTSSASKYLRGFYVGDSKRSLTVRDEITLTKSSEIYWFMNIKADDVSINNDEIILTQNSKRLKLKLLTSADNYEVSLIPGGKLTKEHYLVESNYFDGQKALGEKERRLRIKINAPKGDFSLEVKMAPLYEEAANTPMMNIPISSWTVPIGSREPDGDDYLSGLNYKTGETENFLMNINSEYHIQKKVSGIGGKSESDSCFKYSMLSAPSSGNHRWAQQRRQLNAPVNSKGYFRFSSELLFDGSGADRFFTFLVKGSSAAQEVQTPIEFLTDNGRVFIRVNKKEISTAVPPFGKWFRLDIVGDAENKTFDIFINGIKIAENELFIFKSETEITEITQLIIGTNQLYSVEKKSFYPSDTYFDNMVFELCSEYPQITSYRAPYDNKYKYSGTLGTGKSKAISQNLELQRFDNRFLYYSSIIEPAKNLTYTYSADFEGRTLPLCTVNGFAVSAGGKTATLTDNKISFVIDSTNNTYSIFSGSECIISNLPTAADKSALEVMSKVKINISAQSKCDYKIYKTDFGVYPTVPTFSAAKDDLQLPDTTFFAGGAQTDDINNADSVQISLSEKNISIPIIAEYSRSGKLIKLKIGKSDDKQISLGGLLPYSTVKLMRFSSLLTLKPAFDEMTLRSYVPASDNLGEADSVFKISFENLTPFTWK